MEFNGITLMNGVQFDLNATTTHREGLMHWNSDDNTLELGMTGGNVELQIGQEMLIRAKASENISNGNLVYISSGTGNTPIVSLAKADATSTSAGTIAMATEDVSQDHFGYFTTKGLVRELDTDSYTVGDTLYLSADTAGGFTGTKPTAPNTVIKVGDVIRKSATEGIVYTRIIQRSNNDDNIYMDYLVFLSYIFARILARKFFHLSKH